MNERIRARDIIVGAGQSLRPLRDHIIVKALDWSPSKIIQIAGSARETLRGIVVAVGPGCFPKRYNGPKGVRTKTWDSLRFQPTEVKPGDTVELGGLEIDGYLFQKLIIDNALHVLCREPDIVGIVT